MTYVIKKICLQNSQKWKCRGIRTSRPFSSDWSDDVTLTVIERPKPEVRVNPDHHVFRGETVTLTCDIQTQTHTEWRYSWIKDGTINILNQCTKHECEISSVEFSHQDLPTAKLTVHPETSVFTGETVIMKCDIESDYKELLSLINISSAVEERDGRPATSQNTSVILSVKDSKLNPELTSDTAGAALTGNTVTLICHMTQTAGWDFYWYKHTQNSEKKKTETNSYRVHIDSVSDGGQYWCRAGRGEPVYYTNYSDALWVNVTERPKPEVRVNPDHHVFRGETVTLTCDIQTQTHTEWRYSWIKDDSVNPVSTERVYRITSDKSHSGKYSCRGEKIRDSQRSDISDAVTLTVSAQRPSVSLIISPSRSQHFSSHSLSLNCEDHNNSTGWTVRRNTDSERMKDCSSTGSTCEISSLKTSDTGVYWCESQSGEHSPHINITVHDGDVILESSVHPVIEGDTLTLHCLHRSTNSSILTADFYKDGSLLQKQTTGEMSIPTVSKSHEGFYSCKHGERGQSPESWISVRLYSDGHAPLET
ncbi:sialoadhesin-like [Xyrauchen texanus]|uniref:sialoadhesin-like n=1 Tax=Xyrauchen texanus TaxID=154827 RepID=UPI002241DE48|nr:sialoadhesin-like [Xyrauchen texanus]